ncbi:MAG: iron-containing alcohol dehydrogenase [Candidatus Hodarchaeales archaeon]
MALPFFEFISPVKIYSGYNSLEQLPNELKELGVKNPFIVTDQGIKKVGLLGQVQEITGLRDIKYYDQVPQDSSSLILQEIAEAYRENNCDGLIALGGGSVIDTAKATNLLVSENSNDFLDFIGLDILKHELKPLIVIPTTAGTGSEVTGVAVVKDPERDIKMALSSEFLFAKAAFIDPRMTLGLPPRLTAATAMDALTHAIESYICLQKNPLSDHFSWKAIELIMSNLIPVLKGDNTEKRRLALANGACLAGIALANSIAGVVHSLGHALGGVCHIPHGEAMNIFLPYGLEYNKRKVGKLIEELLLPIAGKQVFESTPEREKADKTIQTIVELKEELYELTKLPRNLLDAGLSDDKETLEKIAVAAINDGSVAYNPEEIEFSDAIAILNKALKN